MTFLTIQDISKRYGPVLALDSIDLQVEIGSRTAIVGPSGSGKTTLLRIIAGFEQPDHGRVVLQGETLADGPSIVPAHRRGIGIVSQDGALFPHLSVAENIGFGIERGVADRSEIIRDLVDMVELDHAMLDRRPHQLSGGQQQRVALARALARKPKLMLLDEPFSALDTGLRENMRKAVARVLQTAGITAILVTHDQAEALSFADQVAVLRGGQLVQAGPPQSLYLRPVDRETATFLGDALLLPADLGEGFADCVLGRIVTDAPAQSGPSEIMLRPEQLHLSLAEGAPDGTGCRGTVDDIEFGGALCTVTLRLAEQNGGSTLMVKCSGIGLPAIGSAVEVTVRGSAHVFATL
ncbi:MULTISPECIES: ABC transporter ATP-binding protein [Rhizobium]|uniref:ABC transporter ATP-binding protein n=1 Tax=Rhizobium rhododendri TaxID=2506430 RepID=A0ABY8IGD8_9HYPH|nr:MULTISPECIES: ABC transporter ATP-binding protein [Rhizobium]MBZ5763471.1 ABC transporter ATP-binding protein [Rhizobium sp. VS19-DR96]MBZ5767604.1 ABC transporter ATP-binding protein [Rhizobium sp. VS19-DR129.2]MBZ5775489.1 ABC transporter ATP-binding protein [Rhizobium sp. VS19-DRK62.2]MBZ5786088.1 ABC transporter ATP-binding protein [Rhizobium sp. VS19-DR121]MBZ5803700.1 ABC transporter ATP-binding protein [Rhizobium sp. VS19-DR181]